MFLIVTVPKNHALLSKDQPHMPRTRIIREGAPAQTRHSATKKWGGGGGHQRCFRFGGEHVPLVPPPASAAYGHCNVC